MEYNGNRHKEKVYTQVIKAGKRTYFFDVEETKKGEKYLVITESRRVFLNDDGKFAYEKSKLFLYKEDYEKFLNALKDIQPLVETDDIPISSDTDLLGDEDSNIDEKINSI